MSAVEDWLAAHQDEAVETLKDFCRIPSVSTDPAFASDIQKAASFAAYQLTKAGFPMVEVIETGGHPVVLAEWCGTPGAPTVLVYGHYDVQPPDPLEKWHSPPFQPDIREDRLYARGVSDDKGPVLIAPPDLRGLRVGVLSCQVSSTPLGHAVTARFHDIVAALGAAGARVVPIDIPGMDQANATLVSILRPEASVIHARLLATNPGGYAPGTRTQIEAGFALPATDYIRARLAQEFLRSAVESVFADVDVLISPSVPFVAPHEDPEIAEGEDSEMLASGFANVTGHPSLSLPMGMVAGLPAGLQLTGPARADARLLSIVSRIEASLTRLDWA